MKKFFSQLLVFVLMAGVIGFPVPNAHAINFYPYVSFEFTDGLGAALTGPLQLRISLWSRFDVKNDDILVSGALNTASDFYGGFQTTMIIPALDIKTVAGKGGLYRLYLPNVPGFPTDLDSDDAYLQIEVMDPPGGLDTDYVMYDFFDDPPDQIITRLRIFEDTSAIDRDPGQGTYFDSFAIDNNDDSSTEIELVFGRILNERLVWDVSNDYFFLSDALVVDGNVNVQGPVLRLDSDETGDPDQDIEIIAVQGTEADGVLRYDDGNNRWELTNDGLTFDQIATFTQIDLDDAYNNFFTNTPTITVDSAQGQSTGIVFDGSILDETLTILNSGNGGGLLIENTGTGDSLRVNDSASDTTPFVIDDTGLVGIGTPIPDTQLHIEKTASSVVNEWVKFDDGVNEVSLLTGTRDPTAIATDADIGSFFFNSTNGLFYIKQDDGNTTNWNKLGLTAAVNNALIGTFGSPSLFNKFVTDTDPRLSAISGNFGEVSIGTRLDYPATNQTISNNYIYFIRVFLPSDTTVSSFGIFTTQAKTGNFNFAMYDNGVGDVPGTLLGQTGAISTTSPVNDFLYGTLGTPIDIATAGFYWVAFATDQQPKAQMFLSAEDRFIPFRVQTKTTGSTTMPVTATPDAKGGNYNLPYIASFE